MDTSIQDYIWRIDNGRYVHKALKVVSSSKYFLCKRNYDKNALG